MTIEYLLNNDFNKLLSNKLKVLDYLIYYGYSIKEFEYFYEAFKNNIIFIENKNKSHFGLVKDDNKKNVLSDPEYIQKMEYIKSKCSNIISNNLDLTNDLINKINIAIGNINEM